jgi:hypothetical protein
VSLVQERTIPNERPPLVGEICANFADGGCRVASAADLCGRILDFLYRICIMYISVKDTHLFITLNEIPAMLSFVSPFERIRVNIFDDSELRSRL